jgi:hypothetical protein
MPFETVDLTAILVVITVFTMAAVIGVTMLLVGMKKRQMEIEAYKKAIEKGLPVPELKSPRSPYSTLRASLIWIAIGLGFSFIMIVDGDRTGMAVGSIPILIGIALAISFAIEKKAARNEKQLVE